MIAGMLPAPLRAIDPGREQTAGNRRAQQQVIDAQPGKPRLLDLETRIPARDRFAPDSPLEGDSPELGSIAVHEPPSMSINCLI